MSQSKTADAAPSSLAWARHLCLGAALLFQLAGAIAQPAAEPNDPVTEAREAARRRDRPALATLRSLVNARAHPLSAWVEYWELSNRLQEAQLDEVESFYARHAGSYLEERLRGEWLAELARRRDWPALAQDHARARASDDREVVCLGLLAEHHAGKTVREAALAAWLAQREADEGCSELASTLVAAKVFGEDDLWRRARLAVEWGRVRMSRQTAGLIGGQAQRDIAELLDNPLRYLRRQAAQRNQVHPELVTLALARAAASEPDAAASQLDERWQEQIGSDRAAWAWAQIGRQAAIKLSPAAMAHYQRGWSLLPRDQRRNSGWSDDTLAWGVRSVLRKAGAAEGAGLVLDFIAAMSAAEQREPAWTYWKARALHDSAPLGEAGQAQRLEARQLLAALASPWHFYGQLATEDLGQPLALGAAPEPVGEVEERAVRQHRGLARALALLALGLRDEGRREWNFSLRGMSDRELHSAARLACDAGNWQLCINTAERTRSEVDAALRYPTPLAAEITDAADMAGVDTAYLFGLIRQETRFMAALRSWAGAAGLMQVMPTTARWTAKRIGLRMRPEEITDPLVNLRIGTSYLRLVLDDMESSQTLAAAAYNAGPSRIRRWREGSALESAAWVEGIPIPETRDYVKKVLANATVYSALLKGGQVSLKARLGPMIRPRSDTAPPIDPDLP